MFMTFAAQGARISAYVAGLGLVVAGGATALRASSAAPASGCSVRTGVPVKVASVLGGGAFTLTDGRRVLLSGIDAPRRGAGGKGAPFETESKTALASLVEGRQVTLSDVGSPSKSGWLKAQVFVGPGVWVQGEMVSKGYARVRTFPDRRECAGELLAREVKARSAKIGIWAAPMYAVRAADQAAQAQGTFGLIEGVVTGTANVGGRVFLNFGEDYRTDFTVNVKQDNVKLFAQSGVDLEALEGKRIRVRGFVRERNGPAIDATVPEQIELLR